MEVTVETALKEVVDFVEAQDRVPSHRLAARSMQRTRRFAIWRLRAINGMNEVRGMRILKSLS